MIVVSGNPRFMAKAMESTAEMVGIVDGEHRLAYVNPPLLNGFRTPIETIDLRNMLHLATFY